MLNRRARIWVTAALVAGAAVYLLGLRPAVQQMHGGTMGTSFAVKYVATAPRDDVEQAVRETVAWVDGLFSTYREDSPLSRFNAHASTAPFEVPEEVVDVCRLALRVAGASDGAFDPTVRPLVTALGFEDREVPPPSAEELATARARVGFAKLRVVDDSHLAKAIPELEIDLNAVAKGWAVDRVIDRLTELDIAACMVEVGGETRCRGEKPDGVPWRIGIEQPPSSSSPPAGLAEVVEVRDFAVATSGDYRNVRAVGGEQLHHILDPRSGRNVSTNVLSVSVRASTCALADALATALMLVGVDGATALLAEFDDSELGVLFLLRGANGEISRHLVRWSS